MEKWFVIYTQDYDAGVTEFDLEQDALGFVTHLKRVQAKGDCGTSFGKLIRGREIEIEPVKVVTEWVIKKTT